MAIATRISEQEYRALALDDPDHRLELWDGVLVEKPSMSVEHNGEWSRLSVSAFARDWDSDADVVYDDLA